MLVSGGGASVSLIWLYVCDVFRRVVGMGEVVHAGRVWFCEYVFGGSSLGTNHRKLGQMQDIDPARPLTLPSGCAAGRWLRCWQRIWTRGACWH